MKLDIKEVIDYCRCPMLYKFRYIDGVQQAKKINIMEKYEQDIHKTAYAFFTFIQDEGLISLVNLKKVWGSQWIGAKTAEEILYSESSSWRDTYDQQRKRGIDVILNIHNRFKSNPGFPIAVNKRYSVDLGNNITLTGTWEVIREIEEAGNKIIQLIDFKVNDRSHNEININHDLEITAASYAFFKTFGIREDEILYYGLDKNKAIRTSRADHDYKVLANTIQCIATAISSKLFYACPNNRCYTCPYKVACISGLSTEK